MGDQIPWHHLQGLHVVLITIIPLPQTPQPFQFLSAQNPEYVTLFSFCKKLFCMKNSQQIKAISLKKRAYEWRLREFWAGPQYRRWEQLCHPSCWLMAQVQLALHCAANRAGNDGMGSCFSPKNFLVRLWTPYSCGRWVIHRSRKASQRCHWIRKQACRERGKKSTIAPPAKEIFHVKCSQPLNPVSTKTSLHALPVCLWSQLRQSLWEEASAQSRPWATADDY